MPSIESLSKRLQPKLKGKVVRGKVPMTTKNYYRLVRRFKTDDWTHMSPAQITAKVVDPALDAIAELLNQYPHAIAAPLPASEDEKVVSFISDDADMPVRMLITPTEDGSEIVVVFDILCRMGELRGDSA
jgi:hypothetical protein